MSRFPLGSPDFAGGPDFADADDFVGDLSAPCIDYLARASEALYQAVQGAKDDGDLLKAGQLVGARAIVEGLRG